MTIGQKLSELDKAKLNIENAINELLEAGNSINNVDCKLTGVHGHPFRFQISDLRMNIIAIDTQAKCIRNGDETCFFNPSRT
jgi:hypothetical protein